jgi:hypothetical protein
MKVLVPVKRVIDYNVKVRVKADGSGVDLENEKGDEFGKLPCWCAREFRPRLVRRNSPLKLRPRRRVSRSWCSTSSGGNSYSLITLLYRNISSALFPGQ